MTNVIAFAPIMNLANCFKPCKSTNPTNPLWNNYIPPKDWVRQLALILANKGRAESIHEALSGHLLSKRLEPTLVRMYALLSGGIVDKQLSFNPKDIPLYRVKIMEGIYNCTSGFENRINELWQGWLMAHTLGERVQTLREELVLRAAHELRYADVHQQNAVTNLAIRLGYGVRATNRRDPFGADWISNSATQQTLHRCFTSYYTPMNIIQNIERQLVNELTAQGYKGKRTVENAYTAKDPAEWIQHLTTQLGQPTDDPNFSWLLTQEDETDNFEDAQYILDINWRAVRLLLLKKLQAQGIFHPVKNSTDLLFKANPSEVLYCKENLLSSEELKAYIETVQDLKLLNSLHLSYKEERPLIEQKIKTIMENTPLLTILESHPYLLGNPSLNLINWESLDPLYAACKKQTATGNNLLILIFNHGHPELIKMCLERLGSLEDTELLNLLLIRNSQGTDVFNCVYARLPSAGPVLALYDFCEQKNIQFADYYFNRYLTPIDQNTIVDLLKYNNPAARSIIDLILKIKIKLNDHQAIGKLLLIIAKTYPDHAKQLLQGLEILPHTIRSVLLQQTNTQQYNALLLAAKYQPALLPQLFGSMTTCQDETLLARIVGQVTEDKNNCLMLAVSNSLKSYNTLRKLIASPELLMQLLPQTNAKGLNVLHIAAMENPDCIKDLVSSIQEFNNEELTIKLLSQTSRGVAYALNVALQKNPHAAQPILDMLMSIHDEAIKVKLLTTGSTMIAAAKNHDAAFNFILTQTTTFSEASKKQILNTLRFETLNTKQLLAVLTYAKQVPSFETNALFKHTLLQEKRFSPQEWYTIATENLVPSKYIKKHKNTVLKHIKTLEGEQRKTALQESLNRTSTLGTFFYTQRGLRKCRESAGSLRKINTLLKQCTATS